MRRAGVSDRRRMLRRRLRGWDLVEQGTAGRDVSTCAWWMRVGVVSVFGVL